MPNISRLLLPALFLLLAACGAVNQMADDATGDDATGDDATGDDATGDDAPDAATTPDPEPDAEPAPECTSDEQCPAEQPVCDDQSCRGCELDTECASGACDYDTGACLAESEVLYVAPLGIGPCTREAPCGWLQDAIPRVTANKHHILIAPATYTGRVTISAANAPFTVHGYGVQLSSAGANIGPNQVPNATVRIEGTVSARFRGLKIGAESTMTTGKPNVAVTCIGTALVLEDTELVGTGIGAGGGYVSGCEMTGRRVTIRASGIGLEVWVAKLTLDASRILGTGKEGLYLGVASFEVTNTVIARSAKAGVNVYGAVVLDSGPQRLAFNTFVDNGSDITADGTDIQCTGGSETVVTNNLVKSPRPYTWSAASSSGTRSVGGECATSLHYNLFDQPGHPVPAGDNVVGPADLAVWSPGLEVDAHLLSTSMAIDAADPDDTGMTADADGKPRPAGAGLDIGAYEYQP